MLLPSDLKKMKQVIETYSEFPHLKVFTCRDSYWGRDNIDANLEIAGAILSRSSLLEEFSTRADHNETDLLKLLAK